METRGTYRTNQRTLVRACLSAFPGRYLTVDDVWGAVAANGHHVGRTTVYRNLEALSEQGIALKVAGPKGEARYRLAPQGGAGQLVCLKCGEALPLDCSMLAGFAAHVREHHGFAIDNRRTVLYGLCADCAGDDDER